MPHTADVGSSTKRAHGAIGNHIHDLLPILDDHPAACGSIADACRNIQAIRSMPGIPGNGTGSERE
ncbi:hypothetical protein [Halothiobacillus sp.]|uniref:hypothetical protein n=1 Tax=Halothiobacillus sp. TaxID=1891311 RepID=UPI00260F363B|nr:hypothetical protein [Halothiobacillus sp.]